MTSLRPSVRTMMRFQCWMSISAVKCSEGTGHDTKTGACDDVSRCSAGLRLVVCRCEIGCSSWRDVKSWEKVER